MRRRRTYRNRKPTLMYTGPGRAPLPDKYLTKLSFQQWYNDASSGSTGVLDRVFRGNGAFDPDSAIGGIGCSGFTELAAIYNNYRVYGSKIQVSLKSLADTTALGDFIVTLIPDRSSTAYTMIQATERQISPFAKTKMVNRYVNGGVTRLSNYRKTNNIFGESDIDDDAYSSLVTSTPANEWFWHVVCARGDQSAISAWPGVQMLVRITYYIRFERRRQLNAP